MRIEKLDVLALNAGVDLEYFTGLKFHLSERPAVLLIPSDGKPVFIFPEFEQEKAKQSLIDLDLYPYPEDTGIWPKVFSNAANKLGLSQKTIGVAPESFRFLELELIQSRYRASSFHFRSIDFEILKNAEER